MGALSPKWVGALTPKQTYNDLKCSFRIKITRNIRKTDATITLDGVRFQVPQCYVHMDSLLLRYARWDLGEAEVLCPDTHKILCFIFPVNKILNSNAARKNIEGKLPIQEMDSQEDKDFLDLDTDHFPPLLAHCLKKHAKQFPFSGYIPLPQIKEKFNE